MTLCTCHPFYRCSVLRGDWPANFQETDDAAHISTTDRCTDACQKLWRNAYAN